MKIDSTQIKSVRKAGLAMYKFVYRDTETCHLSVIRVLILEKIYELFKGTNKTVRNIGMSVLRRCL